MDAYNLPLNYLTMYINLLNIIKKEEREAIEDQRNNKSTNKQTPTTKDSSTFDYLKKYEQQLKG